MKTFQMRFYENRKIFFTISLGIMAIGLIFNIIFGVQLDIQFRGGAMIKYSYASSVDLDAGKVTSVVEQTTSRTASVAVSTNIKSASGGQALNEVTISFAGSESLSTDSQKAVLKALNTAYPNADFQIVESNSVNPSMGQSFFIKCLVAVLIAFLLLDFYIAIRFRKIGGTAAAVFAIVALLHDVAMVYFTFVLVRIPLNDSFIAVVLTILGYSLNDTIVVYDRIRENRRLLGLKAGYGTLVNVSINQTFTRSVYTAGCTFLSIAVVFVVGNFYNLSSVTTFALPMMVGVLTGCYSSICIAGPLYVMWENYKTKGKAAALSAASSAEKTPVPAVQQTETKPSAPAPTKSSVPVPDKPSAGGKTKQRPKGKKKKR